MKQDVSPNTARPLDAAAIGIVVVLCLSWGFNQVAIKLALHDIPPFIQSAARSAIAAVLVAAWARARGVKLFERDGSLRAGLVAGALFGFEFILLYPRPRLDHGIARRAVHLSGAVLRRHRLALVPARRSFPPVAMGGPRAVVRRHRHRVRRCRRPRPIRARCSAMS